MSALAERQFHTKAFEEWVKKHLFKRLKLYNFEHVLYNINNFTVCQKVCNGLNVVPTEKEMFWKTYCPAVKQAIKVCRNDAVAAMKLSFFKGK